MAAQNPRKRKRDADDDHSPENTAKFTLWPEIAPLPGPTLALFNSVPPGDITPFSIYTGDKSMLPHRTLMVGETTKVEFVSHNRDKAEVGYNCEYMIGVRNRSTNQLHVSLAPLYVLGHHIKGNSGLDNAQSSSDYNMARNRLGEAFGTKKARASIRAAERNKVDIAAMSGVSGHLQDGIQSRTDALPSLDEGNDGQNSNPAIPHSNPEAHSPDEVYPLQSVISEAELDAISSEHLEHVAFPYKRSVWIRNHLKNLDKKNKQHRKGLKILYYASTMLHFKRIASKPAEKTQIRETLSSIPDIIVESLISRFTEAVRGSTKAHMTPNKEVALLTHLLTLCLRLDDYACNPSLIAVDLGVPLTLVQDLFKSLGCTITNSSRGQQANTENSVGTKTKLAVLKLPLVFPKIRKRR